MGTLTRREFCLVAASCAAAALAPGCRGGTAGTVTLVGNDAVLPYARFGALAAAGGSVVVDIAGQFPIVVVRTSESAAVALSATCTHAGCIVGYSAALKDIHCDCHDADFALDDGRVLGGPTVIPLPTYVATVGADAISVRILES